MLLRLPDRIYPPMLGEEQGQVNQELKSKQSGETLLDKRLFICYHGYFNNFSDQVSFYGPASVKRI
jgi:hypothetical protein